MTALRLILPTADRSEIVHSSTLGSAELMTPAESLVTAPSTHTFEECVSTMCRANVRHLPICDGDGFRTTISMQDVSDHMSATLKNRPDVGEDVTVCDLLHSVPSPGLSRALPSGASVDDALGVMRETGFAALLVHGSSETHFGIFTERDYVHDVLPYLWYEEQTPSDISLASAAHFTEPEAGHSRRALERIAADPSLAQVGYLGPMRPNEPP